MPALSRSCSPTSESCTLDVPRRYYRVFGIGSLCPILLTVITGTGSKICRLRVSIYTLLRIARSLFVGDLRPDLVGDKITIKFGS